MYGLLYQYSNFKAEWDGWSTPHPGRFTVSGRLRRRENLLPPPGSETRTSSSYTLHRVSDNFWHPLPSDISQNTKPGEPILLPLPGTGWKQDAYCNRLLSVTSVSYFFRVIFKCRPRCTVRIFKSSYSVGLGAPYVREMHRKILQFSNPFFRAVAGI
jgi:hypothetical protein